VTATAVDERSNLPGPTWPPSALAISLPLTERRLVVLADDPCEAGLPASDPEYAGIYLHARYFDPKLGIFLSPDPLNPTLPGVGKNRYSYGFGNPTNNTDRSGFATGVCAMNVPPSQILGPIMRGTVASVDGRVAAQIYEQAVRAAILRDGVATMKATAYDGGPARMLEVLANKSSVPSSFMRRIMAPLIDINPQIMNRMGGGGAVIGAGAAGTGLSVLTLLLAGTSTGEAAEFRDDCDRMWAEQRAQAYLAERKAKSQQDAEDAPESAKPAETKPADPPPAPCRGRGCIDSPYVHPDPTRGGPNYWNPFDYWERVFNPYNPWEGVPTRLPPMQCFSDNPKDCVVVNPN
jgi:RHS repeat-associated protein